VYSALRKIAPIFILLLSASAAMGQVATGTYPYGTFDTPGFDTINVGNLNVHLDISVLHKAGRGMPFTYDLSYDSSVWTPVNVGGVMQWQPVLNWGWEGSTAISTGYLSYSSNSNVCVTVTGNGQYGPPVVTDTGTVTVLSNYVYHDPWGESHPFPGASISSGSDSPPLAA
jgi:hypothetical protein